MSGINKKIVACVSISFAFFYYGLGFMVSYSPDIYLSILSSPNAKIRGHLCGGRLVAALVYWILKRPNQSFYLFYYTSYILAIGFMTFALYRYGVVLLYEISRITEINYINTIFVGLISCLTIANLFSASYFLYPDSMCMWGLAVLLCVEAACSFIKESHGKLGKREYIKIVLFLTISVFSYEIIPALFVILTVPFILAYSYSIRDFIRKQFFVGVLYSIPMIGKTIVTVFIVSSKRASFDSLGFRETAAMYTPQGKTTSVYLLDRITFGMWVYGGLFIAVAVMLAIKAVYSRRFLEIIKGIYIVTVVSILGLLPYILKLTNDYKPRIYYPLGALFGVLVTYGFLSRLIRIDVSKIIYITAITLAMVQWLSFVQMYVDQYITNYEDKYISEIIGEYIAEYEQETEYTINYVVFYSDAERKKYAMDEGWCLTQRAYDATWSRLPALNYWLDKSYEVGEVDDNLVTYFSSYNWDTFSDKQIVFEKDTVHVCCY